jgi:hypothetical protein
VAPRPSSPSWPKPLTCPTRSAPARQPGPRGAHLGPAPRPWRARPGDRTPAVPSAWACAPAPLGDRAYKRRPSRAPPRACPRPSAPRAAGSRLAPPPVRRQPLPRRPAARAPCAFCIAPPPPLAASVCRRRCLLSRATEHQSNPAGVDLQFQAVRLRFRRR